MSFGIGVGDLALVARSAWRLYKACKDSSEDFARLSTELMSLHAILNETNEFLAENQDSIDLSRRHRLTILCDGCRSALDELDAIYTRYESLGTQAQRTWDRMHFGLRDLSDIRNRLVSSVTMLSAFNSAMVNSSQARIEKKISKFLAEVQAGLREGSVVATPDAANTISKADVWKELRRELEDVGISLPAAEDNHEYILERIKKALEAGELDELAPGDTSDVEATAERKASVAPSDSGYGSIASPSERGSISMSTSLSAANNTFEEELRRQRAEWWPNNAGPMSPLNLDRSATGMTESTLKLELPKVRRRTGPVGLIKKMVKKDTAIIEAASDGDIDKVAECISLGMDVNARDRWGWSALSMCGYGGYANIARLLLDHGADLDNVDVDDDTPTSLAAQRGHAQLVVMFDEERQVRDLRVREMDTEVPRSVVH
ncbi:hypothetical protein QBC34DRAFT_415249 [Podospora aff. communis PSN243]|uniref:Fungal N-terminal domain-containing protein n=1 Tax=Podospora aff. communis PSN243 TaxID=3040156 RepID=A0AAV9GAX8_9PEZI|nr:hypothetical protein QBC34DRAFT_415249 [Podospora aff. communis PSN243]